MDEQFGKLFLADTSVIVAAEARNFLPKDAKVIHLPACPFNGMQVIAFMREARTRGYHGNPIRYIPSGLQLREGLEKHVNLRRAHCLRSSSFEDRKTLTDQWVMWAPVSMRTREGAVLMDFTVQQEAAAIRDYARAIEVSEDLCRSGTLTEIVYLALIEHQRTGWPHGNDVAFVSQQESQGERLGIRAMTDYGRLKLEIERWPMRETSHCTIAPIVTSLG